MVRVYKPLEPYSKQADTKIEKIPFLSGLILYGRRISAAGNLNGAGTSVIYTAPDGKNFFLTSALSTVCWSDSASAGTVQIRSYFSSDTAQNRFMFMLLTRNGTDPFPNLSSSVSFSIPIKLVAGETIALVGNAAAASSLAITGYEIDASLIPTFL